MDNTPERPSGPEPAPKGGQTPESGGGASVPPRPEAEGRPARQGQPPERSSSEPKVAGGKSPEASAHEPVESEGQQEIPEEPEISERLKNEVGDLAGRLASNIVSAEESIYTKLGGDKNDRDQVSEFASDLAKVRHPEIPLKIKISIIRDHFGAETKDQASQLIEPDDPHRDELLASFANSPESNAPESTEPSVSKEGIVSSLQENLREFSPELLGRLHLEDPEQQKSFIDDIIALKTGDSPENVLRRWNSELGLDNPDIRLVLETGGLLDSTKIDDLMDASLHETEADRDEVKSRREEAEAQLSEAQRATIQEFTGMKDDADAAVKAMQDGNLPPDAMADAIAKGVSSLTKMKRWMEESKGLDRFMNISIMSLFIALFLAIWTLRTGGNIFASVGGKR